MLLFFHIAAFHAVVEEKKFNGLPFKNKVVNEKTPGQKLQSLLSFSTIFWTFLFRQAFIVGSLISVWYSQRSVKLAFLVTVKYLINEYSFIRNLRVRIAQLSSEVKFDLSPQLLMALA